MICPRCNSEVGKQQRFCGQCGAALQVGPEDEQPTSMGQVLDGRYQLSYLIGQGGMGSVYRAEVVGLGHTVAVKILHPALAADPRARRRLENEARLASQINHPNIVSILDFHSSHSLTYLVMEFLRGVSLREVIEAVGYLSVQRTIHITRQLLSALEVSHRLGVLHRDLKPDNIYLIAQQDSLDFVKVLDFGMAMVTRSPDENRITAHGYVCGTPAYMSPEQARGLELTPRSDLYSVGVVLYECLTGQNPFLGANVADTLVHHLTRIPDHPSRLCKAADIPPYLDALVMRALRKSHEERFESAAEFRRVLEALVLARSSGTQESNRSITTCPECGRPLLAGARICETCKHVMQGPGLGPEAIQKILPPDFIQALEDSRVGGASVRLSPTSSTTCPAISWNPPLVGRERELQALSALLATDPATPIRERFFRLIGAPGTGKGRLAREALQLATARGWQTIWVEADHQPVFAPLHPIQQATSKLLRLPELPGAEIEVLSAAELAGFDLQHQQGLLELLGLGRATADDPADLRRARRAEAWREAIRAASRRGPLLLLFHEIGFFDGPSRELVAALASGPTAAHVIVTEDPGLLMLWPETRTLTVPPLSSPEAVALARDLLAHAQIEADADRIATASVGIPLHLLELVRLAALEPTSLLPRSLAEAITQRLGLLPARPRKLLHAMAVLGHPTSPEALAALLGDPSPEMATLQLLTEQGLITISESGWHLAHWMFREVAYASIPVAVRSILHLEAARQAADAGRPPACIAHHLYEGGDHAGAVPFLLRAGHHALDALDDTLGLQCFDKVLKVIPSPPRTFAGSRQTWLAATLGLATALADRGDLPSALKSLRGAAALADDAGWPEERARCEERRQVLQGRAAAPTAPREEPPTEVLVSWIPAKKES